MSTLELIAKLNAKSPNFMSTGAGSSGPGGFSSAVISGALARVSHPLGSPLLRTMYAGQNKHVLELLWDGEVRSMAVKNGWKAKSDMTFTRLSLATINEHLDCRCRDCMGRGTKRRRVGKDVEPHGTEYREGGYLVVTCDACQGTGKGAQNASVRGRLLNMKPNSYNETWHDRYEMLLSYLSQTQRQSEDEYHRQMKR